MKDCLDDTGSFFLLNILKSVPASSAVPFVENMKKEVTVSTVRRVFITFMMLCFLEIHGIISD